MAYSLVPDANNTVGSDLTAMYDNFVALESAQIVESGMMKKQQNVIAVVKV